MDKEGRYTFSYIGDRIMIPFPIFDMHTHTTHCDGKDSIADMVNTAQQLGHKGIGFSAHSYAPFDESCTGLQNPDLYKLHIEEQRQLYPDFPILCGIELDLFSDVTPYVDFDYTIGSVHYVSIDNQYIAIDGYPEQLRRVCDSHYGGNGLALAEDFYDLVIRSVKKNTPTIIGHFDLITKLNKVCNLFDEESSAYRSMALDAFTETAKIANEYGGIFEVNTGGISRGYRDDVYPSRYLLKEMGGSIRVMITSDSHAVSTLGYKFHHYIELLKTCGYTRMTTYLNGTFKDINIP